MRPSGSSWSSSETPGTGTGPGGRSRPRSWARRLATCMPSPMTQRGGAWSCSEARALQIPTPALEPPGNGTGPLGHRGPRPRAPRGAGGMPWLTTVGEGAWFCSEGAASSPSSWTRGSGMGPTGRSGPRPQVRRLESFMPSPTTLREGAWFCSEGAALTASSSWTRGSGTGPTGRS